jgi:hypothetical protein
VCLCGLTVYNLYSTYSLLQCRWSGGLGLDILTATAIRPRRDSQVIIGLPAAVYTVSCVVCSVAFTAAIHCQP